MPYIGTSPSNGVRRVHTYTATASQTTFTGASSEGVTLSYVDTNYIDVFQNGVLLGSADYTSTSGTSVVLAQGASADDLIVIVVYDVFSVADTVSKTNGGSFDSGVTMSSTLGVTGATTLTGGVSGNTTFTGDIGVGDDVNLTSDSSQITFGADSEVILAHAHNEGLKLQGSGLNTNFSLLSFDTTDGTIPDLRLGKSSSATVGTFAETANGESLGQIRFTGVDSNNGARDGGSIVCTQNASSGASAVSAKVEYTANDHSLFIGTFKALNVASTGRVNINTTENLAQLNVASPNLANSADALRLTNQVNNTGGYFIRFVNSSGGNAGYIEQTGATTISYVSSSDYRLKENVSDMTDATTRLKQLKPKRFNFITEPDTTLDGFLAHEVESIVPEAISGTHNELEVWKEGEELPDGVSVGDNKLDDNGNTIPKYQGIDQSKLVPLLVKTIQELEARITALENAE